MTDIVFIAYGGGHAAALRPVAELALRAGYNVNFLALTTARAALSDSAIPLLGFDDLWEFAAPGARGWGAELAADLPKDGPVSLSESVAYLGISFAELVAEHGEAAARELLDKKGRHAFLPVRFFERFFAATTPDLVVATSSPRSERAAILASGRLGAPSVCVVDLFAPREIAWCGQPGYANRICVLNSVVRDLFLQHGRREDEVVVTGNPAFDGLQGREAKLAGQALRQTKKWDDGITILWASQMEPDSDPVTGAFGDPQLPRRIEEVLRDFVRTNPGYRLVIRYHPNERLAFRDEPLVEFSSNSESLVSLLHAVDIVIVTASTVGLQAHLAGRPVISVDLSVNSRVMSYAKSGISTGVDTLEDLPKALIDMSRQKSSDQGDTVSGKFTSSNAAQKVLNVMESLVRADV